MTGYVLILNNKSIYTREKGFHWGSRFHNPNRNNQTNKKNRVINKCTNTDHMQLSNIDPNFKDIFTKMLQKHAIESIHSTNRSNF